jgi:hypothetical protein
VSVETFPAIRACAQALLDGAVLQAAEVSAGNGAVIDWRTVRSGDTLQTGGDPFDTAQLFVALVGPEVALAALKDEPDPVEPFEEPAPRIHAWSHNEHGQRVRSFIAPGNFAVSVKSHNWCENDDEAAAAFTERLAKLAHGMREERGR